MFDTLPHLLNLLRVADAAIDETTRVDFAVSNNLGAMLHCDLATVDSAWCCCWARSPHFVCRHLPSDAGID